MKASKIIYVLFIITICPNVFGETCYDKVKTDIYAYADGKELTVFKDVAYTKPIQHYLYDDSDNKTKEEIVDILHKDLCRNLFTQICNDNSAKLPTRDSKSCGTTKKPDNQLADVKLEIADTKQKIQDTQFFDMCEDGTKSTRRYTITCSNDDYKIEILYNLDNAKCPDGQEVRNGECVEKEKPNEEAPAQEALQPAIEEKPVEESVDFPKEVHCDDGVTELYLKNNGALLCISKNGYHVNDADWECAKPNYSNHSVLCQNKKTKNYTKVVFLEIVNDDAEEQQKALEDDVDAIMNAFNERLAKEGKQ